MAPGSNGFYRRSRLRYKTFFFILFDYCVRNRAPYGRILNKIAIPRCTRSCCISDLRIRRDNMHAYPVDIKSDLPGFEYLPHIVASLRHAVAYQGVGGKRRSLGEHLSIVTTLNVLLTHARMGPPLPASEVSYLRSSLRRLIQCL